MKTLQHVAIIGYAALITAGFHLLPVIPFAGGVQKSRDSVPYNLFFKFDKFALGVLILWVLGRRARTVFVPITGKVMLRVTAFLLTCSALLMVTALAIHYVRIDFGVSANGAAWAFDNLVLVAFGEEAFFRAYLFENLQRRKFFQRNIPALIAVTAIVFGLVHFRGGLPYIALATVSGVFFGLGYRVAGLAGSVAVHFFVNAIHFVAFSYPALRGT